MLQLALYLQQNANPLQAPFATRFSATPTNESDSMATSTCCHDLGHIATILGHCIMGDFS